VSDGPPFVVWAFTYRLLKYSHELKAETWPIWSLPHMPRKLVDTATVVCGSTS